MRKEDDSQKPAAPAAAGTHRVQEVAAAPARPVVREARSTFSITRRGGIHWIEFPARPDLGVMIAAIQTMSGVPESTHRLWDFTEHGLDLTTSELLQIAEEAKLCNSPPLWVAVVGKTDLTFGLLRMFEIFREQSGVVHRAFRSTEEAEAWLVGELPDGGRSD
ncbi:MAG: hypothetical protein DWQ36_03970 [Acidobacteria bacterium]|nr:MAG: hypothetical protein DWQ30_25225 [Acidobacteriota bacterium]REK10578.1 MAG: hypothetical protein DWQ36_03970 [Acidobacteriota bacterium]